MKRSTCSYLLAGLISGVSCLSASAGEPKIVVGIMVDQLRTDYLDRLAPQMGASGFNRLKAEGVTIPNLDFKATVTDLPSAAAVVYTGAWPSLTGVAGSQVYDTERHRSVPTLSAKGAKNDFSPEGLQLSTIADELVISSGPLSKIYSIAGDAQTAVVTAGHAANAAIWLDDFTGRWVSPAYYTGMPPVVANKNRTAPITATLSSTSWRPLSYPAGNQADNFSHTFNGAGHEAIIRFKNSPLFNSEIANAAIDLLRTLKQSSAASTPMLNVSFSLAPYIYDDNGDSRAELADAYLRLDKDLGRILDALYSEYGRDNVLLFLSSSGYAQEPQIPEGDVRLPVGEVSYKKMESLLNSYLSATYGNADYVSHIHDGNLYLNTSAIAAKGADIRKLRADAKAFLLRMSGIASIGTIDEVLGSDMASMRGIALRINPKSAPDLIVQFAPGWTVVDDNQYPVTSFKVRLAAPATPAFILAPGIEPQTVETPVDATAVAPTVCSLIRIRAPNGAADPGIGLIGNK